MKNLHYLLFVLFFGVLFAAGACNDSEKPKDNENNTELKDSTEAVLKTLERTKDDVIYEVNIRQFTPEGTFKAFEAHIPRLKTMGVDILWLMPIFPISEKNRKGELGSYYAVADYKKVNPNFGTEDDLRSLIKTAHDNDMLVILDWVANHTGWDNHWITEHPEWYTQDSTGQIIVPEGTDWTDVADLNYDNEDMRAAMTDALVYWVKEFDVDGYRCDVAGMVPTDFWNNVRTELDAVKPVFMLAEAEKLELHDKAFDMGYAWHLHHIMNQVAAGKQNADSIRQYFVHAQEEYPKSVYRMAFTSNHDENSWNGTVFERMPESYEAFAVFTYVIPGMPLIYSGQEAGLDKRLEFFTKDEIEWKEHELTQLYTQLGKIKKDNPALFAGEFGGDMELVKTDKDDRIFAFTRTKDENTVLAVFNFSAKPEDLSFSGIDGTYIDAFSGQEVNLNEQSPLATDAWGYKVLIRKAE